MTKAKRSTQPERKQRVLDTALSILRSGDVRWHSVITYDDLEQGSGIDRKQIASDFGSKNGLISELIDHGVKPADADAEWMDGLEDASDDLMADDSIGFADKLMAFAAMDASHVRTDRRIFTQMAMWAFASEDPKAASRLKEMYRFYDLRHEALWRSAIAALDDAGLTMRDGIAPAEFVTVMTALIEGLAIRAAVDEESVADDLAGRVLVALVESLAQPEAGSVGDRLTSHGL